MTNGSLQRALLHGDHTIPTTRYARIISPLPWRRAARTEIVDTNHVPRAQSDHMPANGRILAPQRAEQIQSLALVDTPTVIRGGARPTQAGPAPPAAVCRVRERSAQPCATTSS